MTLYADPAMDLVFDGHTTYTFDPAPLPADTAERLYDLVKHAPTAFNAQPMRLFAVTEQTKPHLLPLLVRATAPRPQPLP